LTAIVAGGADLGRQNRVMALFLVKKQAGRPLSSTGRPSICQHLVNFVGAL
jgi:hypothetical protein